MNPTDLIILTVYLISVYYVLREAWYSIPIVNSAVIQHEGNGFDYERLKDFLDVKFKLDNSYVFSKQPSQLTTTVINKTNTATITIDWERGSMGNFQGGDRRLFRLIDGMQKGDQSKVQASSTVAPRRSLTVNLTAEDLLEANPETSALSATKPIIDILKLSNDQAAKPKDKGDAEKIAKLKTTYNNFVSKKEPLKFTVRFPVQITNIVEGSKKDIWGFVECNFSVSYSRLTRLEQLPWNPKKKK